MPYNNLYLKELKKLKPNNVSNVELAEAKKIELSLADDANDVAELLEKTDSELNEQVKLAKDISEEWNALEKKAISVLFEIENNIIIATKAQDEAIGIEGELEKAANQLGMSPKDLPFYNIVNIAATKIDDAIIPADDIMTEITQKFGL